MTYLRSKPLAAVASRRWLRVLLGALSLAASSAVAAASFSVGLGAGADRGTVDCRASFPCSRSSTHWKISGDYQLSEAIDLQAVYFDAGRFKGADITPLGTEFGGTFKVSGIGLNAGYRLQFAPLWSLVGRAGFASVRTGFDYAAPFSGSPSKTTLQPLAGVGVDYALTPSLRVGIDYAYTRFKAHETQGPLHMFGIAAQFAF